MDKDLIVDEEVAKDTFLNSIRSFYMLLFTLATCFAMFLATLARAFNWNLLVSPYVLLETLPLFLFGSIILGFIFAILSVRRKEPRSKRKIAGLVGNISFFCLLLVMLGSIILDISRLT